ncbi:MAG TPA: CYTH domain-containing protein [Chitinophagaceae bacterium]|nr:CYTH domain-containing protein [Chitinophagaceae bacterium]
MPQLFEFKARVDDWLNMEKQLLALNPVFKGTDIQEDTYFNGVKGRLKLREGSIENALIHYQRKNIAGAKPSDVLLYQHQPEPSLKEILTKALGIKIIIKKSRKIYFVDNVKIHFDIVQDLGNFIEVEAIDKDGTIGIEKLKEQCNYFISIFKIRKEDFIAESYSDLLLNKKAIF